MDNTIRILFKARNHVLLSKREEMNFTQLEMAKYCGVSMGLYGAVERLDYEYFEATEKNLRKIAETLEIDFEKLFPRWAPLVGKAINSTQNYLLLDDDFVETRMLSNEFGNSPRLLKESFYGDLEQVMGEVLTERETWILKNYYGLNGIKPMKMGEMAERFGMERTRVNQIRNKALMKLRHCTPSKLLRTYLNESFKELESDKIEHEIIESTENKPEREEFEKDSN
ncbi:MAG: hypothetical protein A2V66_16685 [Ignavibacteria bacterium RBG_13_36_8]|nr:MAG: hypothetical protein A2V66_16685 [Ignavibacteria bacterium RBG_13_36_8]